jgi:hypothetical protein
VVTNCKRTGSGIAGAASSLWALLMAWALLTGCASQRQPDAATARTPAEVQQRPEVVTQPIELTAETVELLEPKKAFRLGIESEREAGWPHLKNKRVALVTNNTSMDQAGIPTLERFLDSNLFTLARVFCIEDTAFVYTYCMSPALARVPAERLTVLTAENFRPGEETLRDVDVIVWDVALTGPRFNVDTVVFCSVMEQAALQGVRVLVTDRPNVTPMALMEGPPGDADQAGSRASILPISLMPGLTVGELAQLVNREFAVQADLTIVPMENWARKDGNAWLDDKAPRERLTEAGHQCRMELNHSLFYRRGYVEFAAILDLTGPTFWEHSLCSADGWGLGYLALVPRGMEPAAFLEALQKVTDISGVSFALGNPPGTENWGKQAVVLTPAGEGMILPGELSLLLQYTAREGAKDNPAPPGVGLYGSKVITQAVTRGLAPDQVRRRLAISSDGKKWPETRARYMRYGEE